MMSCAWRTASRMRPVFTLELRQAGGQKFGRGIGIDGETVFLHRFVRQFAASVGGDLFFVQMRHRVVVIGGGMVHFVGEACAGFRVAGFRLRRFSAGVAGLVCADATAAARNENTKARRKILFMLDLMTLELIARKLLELIALPEYIAIGCKTAGPGFSNSNLFRVRWGKTVQAALAATKRKYRDRGTCRVHCQVW